MGQVNSPTDIRKFSISEYNDFTIYEFIEWKVRLSIISRVTNFKTLIDQYFEIMQKTLGHIHSFEQIFHNLQFKTDFFTLSVLYTFFFKIML